MVVMVGGGEGKRRGERRETLRERKRELVAFFMGPLAGFLGVGALGVRGVESPLKVE